MYCFCFTEIEEVFGGILENEQDVSAGMAAIRTLLNVLERDTCKCVLFYMIQLCVILHSKFISDPVILLHFVKISFGDKGIIEHIYPCYT